MMMKNALTNRFIVSNSFDQPIQIRKMKTQLKNIYFYLFIISLIFCGFRINPGFALHDFASSQETAGSGINSIIIENIIFESAKDPAASSWCPGGLSALDTHDFSIYLDSYHLDEEPAFKFILPDENHDFEIITPINKIVYLNKDPGPTFLWKDDDTILGVGGSYTVCFSKNADFSGDILEIEILDDVVLILNQSIAEKIGLLPENFYYWKVTATQFHNNNKYWQVFS